MTLPQDSRVHPRLVYSSDLPVMYQLFPLTVQRNHMRSVSRSFTPTALPSMSIFNQSRAQVHYRSRTPHLISFHPSPLSLPPPPPIPPTIFIRNPCSQQRPLLPTTPSAPASSHPPDLTHPRPSPSSPPAPQRSTTVTWKTGLSFFTCGRWASMAVRRC